MKYFLIALIPFLLCTSLDAREEYITGNWYGLRDNLSNNGVEIDLTYKSGFWTYNNQIESINSLYYIDLFEGIVLIKSEDLFGINLGELNTHIIGINGQTPNDHLGTFQGFDNAEAGNQWTIMNLYYNLDLFNNKLNFKIGLIDLNETNDSKTTAGLFLNPSHGIGPEFSQSGVNGPSIYPLTSLAAIIDYEILPDFHFVFGIFDAVRGNEVNNTVNKIDLNNNDGFLVVMEAYHLEGISIIESDCSIDCKEDCDACNSNDYSKVSLGGWYYTESMDYVFSNLINFGFYGYYEHDVFIEPKTKSQGLALYSKIGIAKDEVNPLSFYFGLGIQYVGLIPGRDNDQFGIGFSSGHFSNLEQEKIRLYRNLYSEFETNLEITYNLWLKEYFSIQFNYQWFNQPADFEFETSLNMFGVRFFLNI